MSRDLHVGFRDPRRAKASELTRFLEEVDQLPGVQAIQRAQRRAIEPRPGQEILDAGCGIGLETVRLATARPQTLVTGLDRNGELLEIARRNPAQPANLSWLQRDLTQLDLPDAGFDAVRTERVLMYLAGEAFEHVVGELVRLLRPGGVLALFELDYGATILPPGTAGDAAVRRVDDALAGSLPEPWAGRRLPRLLIDRGLHDVAAHPYSFAVNEPVWRRIVYETLHAKDEPLPADVGAWLEEHAAAAVRGEFAAAFTGILTTARVPVSRVRRARPAASRERSGARGSGGLRAPS
jgi:SAM-dependent methyltransferase